MLKGIPKIISPELLKVLCEMGHGDRILIGDGNFPAEAMGKNAYVVRADGHGAAELLDAVLQLIPLDAYIEKPVQLMAIAPRDAGSVQTPIWDEFNRIIEKYDDRGADAVGHLERFEFYDASKTCYAIVASGESAIYANVMLQKGVIK